MGLPDALLVFFVGAAASFIHFSFQRASVFDAVELALLFDCPLLAKLFHDPQKVPVGGSELLGQDAQVQRKGLFLQREDIICQLALKGKGEGDIIVRLNGVQRPGQVGRQGL